MAKRLLPWVVLAAIVAFIAWKLHSSSFDWGGFRASLRTANFGLIALAILVIYSQNLIRAMRWAVFLRPACKAAGRAPVRWTALFGTQFIGFAGLAILGRIGELIRPILVARRTGFTVSSQIAVVTVERVFDLAAFGLIFAGNLLLAPSLQALPYLHRAGYTIAALTLAIVVFVIVVRLAGDRVAALAGKLPGRFGIAIADKILSFRAGLDVIAGPSDFLIVAVLSLLLWSTIACAYVLVLKAFPAPVHLLTVAQTIVMMGFSVAGSALPVPSGSGAWAGNTFALSKLLGIPGELAVSAGLMVWMVTTVSIIPAGLIFARIEGVSLRAVGQRSEQLES